MSSAFPSASSSVSFLYDTTSQPKAGPGQLLGLLTVGVGGH